MIEISEDERHPNWTPERRKKLAAALVLQEVGWGVHNIGSAIGVSGPTVFRWLKPEKAEKNRELCRAYVRERGTSPSSPALIWSKEAIIEAIRRWVEENGDIPTAKEWQARTREPYCPPYSSIAHRFERWNLAIEAAGYEPRKPGYQDAQD